MRTQAAEILQPVIRTPAAEILQPLIRTQAAEILRPLIRTQADEIDHTQYLIKTPITYRFQFDNFLIRDLFRED